MNWNKLDYFNGFAVSSGAGPAWLALHQCMAVFV